MSTRTKTGLDIVPQPSSYSYTRQGGFASIIVEDFAGANAQQDAYNFCYPYSTYCESWDVQPTGGGCYRATVKFSSITGTASDNPNVPLNDVWELQPNIVEKDLMEADMGNFSAHTGINGLTMAMKKFIRDQVNGDGTALDTSKVEYTSGTSGDGGQKKTMDELFKLMTHGVKSVRVFAPTLRHTILARPDYSVVESITNCGKIIVDIAATESIPSTLIFNLPTPGATQTIDGITLKYGWFKKYPTVTQVAAGKWQITQELEYGLWSTTLYQFV